MSNLSTLPKGDSAWLLRKAIQRIIQQISVLETNIGSSTTGNSANTQVIFNDNGVLRGDAGLTYNAATDLLTVGAATITGDLTAARLNVTGSTIPTNGVYLASTNNLTFAFNSTLGMSLNAGGLMVNNTSGFNTVANIKLKVGGRFLSGISGIGAYSFGTADAGGFVINDAGDGSTENRLLTLNSTGLGVGTIPGSATGNARFAVLGGATYDGQFNITANFTDTALSSAKGVLLGYNNTTNNGIICAAYGGGTEGLTFWTHNGSSWGQRMELTAIGNLGLGVTPSAWFSSDRALEFREGWGSVSSSNGTGAMTIANNAYESAGGTWTYKNSNGAGRYEQLLGVHRFFTAASGTAGNAITFTQAMTLDASGNLLVGTTNTSATAGPGFKAQYSSTVPQFAIVTNEAGSSTALSLYNVNATAYRFYVNNAGTVFATNTTISAISDARLKENVQDIDVGLGAILALKPRKFDWKSGKGKDIKGDRGFIAQEFEQVFPNLVDDWKDNAPEGEAPYKSVRQDLIPVLVKAIQELTARVQTLEAK